MYNKLFAKILDSSVWLEDHATVRVWFTLMAVMDEDGFCAFASPANLANRARVSVTEAEKAVERFEAPDTYSTDPDNEGRRIERVPGGWIVLNSMKYRKQVTREEIRRQTRERVQRYRDKKKPVTQESLQKGISNGNGNGEALQKARCNADITQEVEGEETREGEEVKGENRARAKRSGEASARDLRARVESVGNIPVTEHRVTPFDDDLTGLVREIVCAYPRSLLRTLVGSEVRMPEQTAVLDALVAEQGCQGGTMRGLAGWLLGRTREFAARVPEGEWKFLPRVDEFFKGFEYRREPEEFTRAKRGGSNAGTGGSGVGRGGSARGTDGNEDALRELVEAARRREADTERRGEDGGDWGDAAGVGEGTGPERDAVGEAVRGGAVGPEPDRPSAGIRADDGGRPLLAHAGAPKRAQWPGFHG